MRVFCLFLLVLLVSAPTLSKFLQKKNSDHGKNLLLSSKKELTTYTKATLPPKTTTEDPLYDDDDYDDDDDDDLLYDEDDDEYYEDDYEDDVIYETDQSGCPTPFLGRCRCGRMNYIAEKKYVVNCTNAGFTNASMLRALPEETEVLLFTGNYIDILPTNIFGTVANFENLETIDMSNNGIKEIKGKTYHRVSNVKTLILNHNMLYIVDTKHHPRVFSNFKNLESLHLTNAFTEEVDSEWYMISLDIIFQGSMLTKLKKLHLEQNEIWSLRDPRTFCHLPSLQQLYLGSNRLAGVNFNLLCLDHLIHLGLEYNSIRRLDANATTQLDKVAERNTGFSIRLTGNPFFCDCDIKSFYEWMQTTRVHLLDSKVYRCFAGRPATNKDLPVLQLQQIDCAPPPPPAPRTSAASVVLGVLVFIMCVLLAVLVFMHRHRLLRRAKELHPQLQTTIQNIKRSRQYTNIEQEHAPEVEV